MTTRRSLTIPGLLAVCLASAAQVPTITPDPQEPVVMVGAGDIAKCDMLGGAEATARLLDTIAGTVFTVGDHAYESGSAQQFRDCYEPTWGRHKDRTRPAPGNHDYRTKRGEPYFEYFGENAGPAGLGYYSYDVGSWHVVSLNSVETGARQSAQLKWLKQDLEASPTACTLAYWHVPVFSSGPHGPDPRMRDVWRLLYEHGADVVVSGHDHIYERFAQQDADGQVVEGRGIRQFTVGTGGGGVYALKRRLPNSEVVDNTSYGVLKLTLRSADYDWEFIPAVGQFRDSGTSACVVLPEAGPGRL